ncbi:MAG TPA: murein L,D-transpeptidase catalytic domain family protein [Croceibacterium sp.]|nr:murein L,D-transpeptidase catalytic domain family protein [Croceibacterium sp.]
MNLSFRAVRGAVVAAAASLALASCVSTPAVPPAPAVAMPAAEPTAAPTLAETAPAREDLPPLIAEALAALEAHSGHVPRRDKIGVVDFSLPSREPRFHVVDVATRTIERSWLVAHGSGSDPNATGMVQRFSNQPGSHASSRGAYPTANTYVGQHGRSQRLIGLDAENDMAMDRAIVIHGADYVSGAMAARQGRIGRSQGCFAFAPDDVAQVIDTLGEGRMIYAGKA